MSRVYDFKYAALQLPGVQRVFMADMPATGQSITDYSPNAINAKFNYVTAAGSVFTDYGQQQPILRRQRDPSFSIRARDHGGRGIGNYIDINTPLAYQGQSFWHVATVCITALDQPHCIIGQLCVPAGGSGNAFALIVNTDGSISCGFDTTLANLQRSAAGVWKAPWAHVAVVSFDATSGHLQVYVDNVLVIDVSGLAGITSATIGNQRLGLLGPALSNLTITGLAPSSSTATISNNSNLCPTGGLLGVVKTPLPGPSTLWSPDYNPDPTQDYHETFSYTTFTGTTVSGVSPNNPEGVPAAASYAAATPVVPYFYTFRRGFYGPWTLGLGSPLTTAEVAEISQQSGLIDTDPGAPFSRRSGHRNRKLPKIYKTDPMVDANSASYMATINAKYSGNNFLNTVFFTERIIYADDTTPLVSVINHHCSKTQLPSNTTTYMYGFDYNMHEWLRLVPIPANLLALPQTQAGTQIGSAGSDHDAVVVHRTRGRLYSFWGIYYDAHPSGQPPNANNDPVYVGDSRCHCRWGGVMADLDDQDAFWQGANAHWGASASSQESYGGLITVQEARDGYIPHIIDCAMSGNSKVWRWPAQRTDGYSTTAFAPEEGMILILPQDVVINETTVTTGSLGLAICQAFQDHGFKLRDTNSGGSVTFFAEPGAPYVATEGWDPWTGLGPDGVTQVVPSSETLLGPHGPSNLIPPSIFKQAVVLDQTAYQTYMSRRSNPPGRRR